MSEKITLVESSFRTPKSRSYSKIFNTMWYMVLFLTAFTAGCKKDNFKAVQGVCPLVTTDPLDKAVDVVLPKVITATFNTAMDPATINNTTFTITQGAT